MDTDLIEILNELDDNNDEPFPASRAVAHLLIEERANCVFARSYLLMEVHSSMLPTAAIQ